MSGLLHGDTSMFTVIQQSTAVIFVFYRVAGMRSNVVSETKAPTEGHVRYVKTGMLALFIIISPQAPMAKG